MLICALYCRGDTQMGIASIKEAIACLHLCCLSEVVTGLVCMGMSVVPLSGA
jgi:hypothetical protein